jgi:hypothetical protein
MKEHLHQLRLALELLQLNSQHAKESRYKFAKDELVCIGNTISKDGVKADPTKIRIILDWPTLKNTTQLRVFHGLFSFYRKFVQILVTSWLIDLTKDQLK